VCPERVSSRPMAANEVGERRKRYSLTA